MIQKFRSETTIFRGVWMTGKRSEWPQTDTFFGDAEADGLEGLFKVTRPTCREIRPHLMVFGEKGSLGKSA